MTADPARLGRAGMGTRTGGGYPCARLDSKNPAIRLYEPFDEETVVKLALRAWEPVLAAVEQLLGSELFSWPAQAHGDARGVGRGWTAVE